MDYVCGPVILYSQDKIRMMDFLSDVFEFEVDPEEDLIHNEGFNLKLIELPPTDQNSAKSPGIKFAFKLKNTDQIKEIVNKYNFFLYRKADPKIIEEICHLDEGNESLAIKDIDGRIWQFDVEPLQ